MEKSIQIYEPMRQVVMKDGRVLFFPKKKDPLIQDALKNDPFVTVEGVTINKFEIKYIEDVPEDYDVLVGLSEDQRNAALAEFRKYKENLGVEPTREVKLKKIARICEKELS